MIFYFVSSLVWFLLGTAAGAWAMNMSHDLREVKETVVKKPHSDGPGSPNPGVLRMLRHSRLNGGLFGALILVVTITSATAGFLSYRKVTTCQRDYVNAFTQSLTARQDIADQDRTTLDTLFKSFTTATTQKQATDALQKYLAARKAADRARANHPLPDPSKGICGG